MVASTAVDDTSVLGNGSQPGTLGFATGTPMTYGQVADDISFLGSLAAWDGAHGNDFIIGRCLRNLTFATGTADAIYEDDIANVSLTTEGAAEFKALSRVQTVPGLKLAGSGTAGAPGWLLKAAASPAGSYKVMTILIRL